MGEMEREEEGEEKKREEEQEILIRLALSIQTYHNSKTNLCCTDVALLRFDVPL